MCGIAGINRPNKAKLKKMLDTITHRGPDGEGMELNDNFSIGMRRLAIIDPNSGWQPIYSEDGTVCIVFNGEIYNYEGIWQELKASGHKFKTDHSDTETVLHGYEEWGYDVVKHLTGMFAFVVYDSRKKILFIARDRLGIKPMYYAEVEDSVYPNAKMIFFASEIKALLVNPEVKKAVDKSVLYEYLMYRVHDRREETFFSGIKRLLPGHYMVVSSRGIEEKVRYWNPTCNTQFSSNRSDNEYASEFYDIYKKVIKRHLIADVPVGVSLSGGLDSSGVCSVMRELLDEGADLHTAGNTLYTFSALFPGQTIDESKYITEVVKYIKGTPVYAYPKVEEFWNEISNWLYTQEEPTISTAPYAYYSVYKVASKHVKVMLSGNGGDELLAGYLPYLKSYIDSAIDQGNYLAAMREFLLNAGIYPAYFENIIAWKYRKDLKDLKMANYLSEDMLSINGQFVYNKSRNLNERLMQDVLYYSTPNLLRYEDKNSMAFSIESRVPFLDHELVEYIFNLPIDQKIKKGWTRYVYRNAMKGHMPELNRTRRSKIGFTNPELKWMKEKASVIADIFGSDQFRSRGFFNSETILSDFGYWLKGKSKGDPLVFWRILNTELWIRTMID